MKAPLVRLPMIVALCGGASIDAALPATDQALTARHLAQLIAEQEKLAELTLFFTRMPKGGDLHHHYSVAIYAEQDLEWVDQQGYCIDQTSYPIETDPALIASVTTSTWRTRRIA